MDSSDQNEDVSTPVCMDTAAELYMHNGGGIGGHLKTAGFNTADAKKRGNQKKVRERAVAFKQASKVVDTPLRSVLCKHQSPGAISEILLDCIEENIDPNEINKENFTKISNKINEATGLEISGTDIKSSWYKRLGGTEKRKLSKKSNEGESKRQR
jgi:hypothetical protein